MEINNQQCIAEAKHKETNYQGQLPSMTLTYKHASYGEMQRSVILNQNVMSFSLCACPLPSKIVMKTTRNSLHPNES